MGGYGYLTEYGLEQIWRVARICAIYEGTNGIHAKSLATRGLKPDGGADAFEEFVTGVSGESLDQKLLATWRRMKKELERSHDPSASAREFYEASAALLQYAVWRKIRGVANRHPDAQRIRALSDRVSRVA